MIRRITRLTIGPWFYQGRIDATGKPLPWRPCRDRIGQWLTEHGIRPPWLFTLEQCRQHWTASGSGGAAQTPASAAKDDSAARFLDQWWQGLVSRDGRILEVGCSCGVHLEHLRRMGYMNLAGVEPDANALQEGKRLFPELFAAGTFVAGDAAAGLTTLPDGFADVIYSIAALQHVHPSSRETFIHLARVARRAICTIECETACAVHLFPRDYRRVFSRLGFRQERTMVLSAEATPELPRYLDGYRARLLVRQ